VCTILEVGNPSQVAGRLDDDEKGICLTDTLGGPQNVAIINESGLWSVVLTSRRENAKRFKKWLTSEVIPSIRKTGTYSLGAAPTVPLTGLEYALALVDAEKRAIELKQNIIDLEIDGLEKSEEISKQTLRADVNAGKIDDMPMKTATMDIERAIGIRSGKKKRFLNLTNVEIWINELEVKAIKGYLPKSTMPIYDLGYAMWFKRIPGDPGFGGQPGSSHYTLVTAQGRDAIAERIRKDTNREITTKTAGGKEVSIYCEKYTGVYYEF